PCGRSHAGRDAGRSGRSGDGRTDLRGPPRLAGALRPPNPARGGGFRGPRQRPGWDSGVGNLVGSRPFANHRYQRSVQPQRGQVFKIRCKKCSHIIVVRGGESVPEAAAPAADGGWHVVIDGEQVGPLADADVRSKIEHGEIKADTYTWKEGFADWVKLSVVPEFSGLVSGDEVAAAAAGGGGELFTATPASTNGAERSRRASSAGASLFGGGDAGDVFA